MRVQWEVKTIVLVFRGLQVLYRQVFRLSQACEKLAIENIKIVLIASRFESFQTVAECFGGR